MATAPDIEIDEDLKQSLEYCEMMIADGDELGMFAIMKRTLLKKTSDFEEWHKQNKSREFEL